LFKDRDALVSIALSHVYATELGQADHHAEGVADGLCNLDGLPADGNRFGKLSHQGETVGQETARKHRWQRMHS